MAWPDSLAEQMATDYLLWVDTETITYFAKSNEVPPPGGVVVNRTLWLAIKKDRLKADSLLATMDLTVDLAKLELGGIVPKIDDVMQRADGTRWVIKIVEIVACGNEYRCHVKRSQKAA